MSEQKSADNSQREAARPEPVRGAEEVGQNQPGSKGDGSTFRAGQGNQDQDQESEEGIVRSRSQKPNANQTATEATMEPGGDLGHKRTTL
jgi:hypothetical protein